MESEDLQVWNFHSTRRRLLGERKMQVPERKNYHRFFFVHNLFAVLTSICGFSTVPLQVQILVVVVVAVVVAVLGAVSLGTGASGIHTFSTYCHPLVVSVVFALLVVFCLVLVVSVLVLVVLAVSDVSVGSVRSVGKFCFSLSATRSVGVCARRGHSGSDSGSDSGSNTVGYYCIVG